jgi:hypothetical protein
MDKVGLAGLRHDQHEEEPEAVASGRRTVDLFDLPLSFSQRPALTPEQFSRATKNRGRELRVEQLEALHRAGVLMPFYRIDYDARTLVTRASGAGQPIDAGHVETALGYSSTSGFELAAERAVGDLHDPADEAPVPWRATRTFRGSTYRRSRFLYSEYQLLALDDVSALPMRSRWRSGKAVSYRVTASDLETHWATSASLRLRSVAIALAAVEAPYLPDIVESVSLPIGGGYNEWASYADSFEAATVLRWLGWTPLRLREEADRLFARARWIDPSPDLFSLLRLAHPSVWKRLKGEALRAFDNYIASEMLMRAYDALSGADSPIHGSTEVAAQRFSDTRLKADRTDLDRQLMRAGLSPHPGVVMPLEGKTEYVLMPDIFNLVYGAAWRPLVELLDAGGADRNLEALAAHVATPRLGERHGRTVDLVRPPIRLLVVTDPEGKRLTPRKRKLERRAWIKRIWERVPVEHRTAMLCRELHRMVEIVVWNDDGESFEFANFTDWELARAIVRLDRRRPRVTVASIAAIVRDLRARAPTVANPNGAKISDAWRDWPAPQPTKGQLALVLRPILVAKVHAHLGRRDERRVLPALRVARDAVRSASRFPRNALLVIRR